MHIQKSIQLVKQTFSEQLSLQLKLTKVAAPLFVSVKTGVQDDLNGIERPVCFSSRIVDSGHFEIVHSLAKWKRMALAKYGVPVGEGIYTDMMAIRPDEPDLSSRIHSIFVDQWDWEKVMDCKDRNLLFLKKTVKQVYSSIKQAEMIVCNQMKLTPFLPSEIHFVHTEELADRFPTLSSKEKEDAICKEYGAVFLIGIGGELQNGEKHDGRAPDYDDWSTATEENKKGLNGDVLVWNPVLGRSFEISSMGIRVDKEALRRQLTLCDCLAREELDWHQMLLTGKLPQSIGGGIGQSRLTMLLLQKQHIGEVQVSAWPEKILRDCREKGVMILQ